MQHHSYHHCGTWNHGSFPLRHPQQANESAWWGALGEWQIIIGVRLPLLTPTHVGLHMYYSPDYSYYYYSIPP